MLVTSVHRTKCVIALRLSGQESKSFPVLTHFVRGGKTELKWRYKTRGHQTQKCPRARSSRALSLSKSGQTRHAVAPVDRTGLDCLDTVVRFAFLQVVEERSRLVRRHNNQRCPKRQVVHRSKQQCVANNLRQGVNNKLILANGGILRNDVRGSLTVITAAATTVSRCLSLRSFLSSVSVAATTATSV